MNEVIRDMPTDERPRERMRMHGAETLSDAELLAVLLGSGVPGKNAINVAREMLRDGFRGLGKWNAEQLAKIDGVGSAKAARLLAAFEVARRIAIDKPPDRRDYDADVIARELIEKCRKQTQERLGAFFLDSRRRIMHHREIFVGTIAKALVSTRDVIRFTLEANAVGVVLYHNHPSGEHVASDDDINFTVKMTSSLALCDIDLVDHLVIGDLGYSSLAQKGLCAPR